MATKTTCDKAGCANEGTAHFSIYCAHAPETGNDGSNQFDACSPAHARELASSFVDRAFGNIERAKADAKAAAAAPPGAPKAEEAAKETT